MRRLLVVTYDISSPQRWRKVFRCMKGFGQHLQLSVFRCDLTAAERLQMMAELSDLIHHLEDQVFVVDLGPSKGIEHRIETIGRPSEAETRGARVF